MDFTATLGTDVAAPEGEKATITTSIQTNKDVKPDIDRHVAICIDVSGSMSGSKIESVKTGLTEVLDVLDDDDHVSLVRFASDASVVVPGQRIGSNRATIASEIESLSLAGGTNIREGMKTARRALLDSLPTAGPDGSLTWIVLVSDGMPANSGDLFARVVPYKDMVGRHIDLASDIDADGITVHAAGVGETYHEGIMRGVAEETRGEFEHVTKPHELERFFTEVATDATDVVTVNPELRIRLLDGCELETVYQHQPYHNELDVESNDGNHIVELPDIAADETQEVLIEVEIPPGEAGSRIDVARCTLVAGPTTATRQVEVTFAEEAATQRLTQGDKKRIETKARRLAVETSPSEALSYLDRQSVDAPETRAAIRELDSATNTNEARARELRSDLTSSTGLARADTGESGGPDTTESEATTNSTDTESASGAEPTGPDVDRTASETSDEPRDPTVNTGEESGVSDEGQSEASSVADPQVESGDSPEVDVVPQDESDTAGMETPTVGSTGSDVPSTSTEEADGDQSSNEPAKKLAIILNSHEIPAGGKVTLTVRNQDGERVTDALVEIGDSTTRTDSRGSCQFTLDEPGPHTVRALVGDGRTEAATTTVIVKPSETTDTEMGDGDSDGEAEDGEASETTGDTPADGDSNSVTGGSASQGETDNTSDEKQGAGGPVSLAVIPGNRTMSIEDDLSVTVRDESGSRVAGATVSWEDGEAVTDDRGTCEVSFSSPGEHTLVATKSAAEKSYEASEVVVTVNE